MALFLKYLKQKRWLFAVGAAFALVFSVSFFLYRLPVEAVMYPTLLCTVIGLVILIFDFQRVKGQHKELARIKSITDAIAAVLPGDESIQNEDYREIIRLLCEEHPAPLGEQNPVFRFHGRGSAVWDSAFQIGGTVYDYAYGRRSNLYAAD